MERQMESQTIAVLAKLLGGRTVDPETVVSALELICNQLSFVNGAVYEANQFNEYVLCEHYGSEEALFAESFGAPAFEAEEGERLLSDSLCVLRKAATETICGVDNGNVSVIASPIALEEPPIFGLIVLVGRQEMPLSQEAQELLGVLLSMLRKYISARVYKNRLSFTQKTFESILDNTGIDIYVNDFNTHDILYANKSMAAPYGGISQFMGRKCREVLFPGQTGSCEFCPQKNITDEDGNPTKVYTWDYQRPFDGSWFRVFSAAFRWIDGRLAHVVSSADITDNKRNEAIIQYMANYDSLTDLPNRRKLIADMEKRMANIGAGETGYLLFFDIDGFKTINDTLGHDAGDEFLVKLGQFFTSMPLLKDSIYRNGGDEFVALTSNELTEMNARNLIGFIHTRFRKPWKLKKGEVSCNVSVGVARYPGDGETAEELLYKADQAMYHVKKAGGGAAAFAYQLTKD